MTSLTACILLRAELDPLQGCLAGVLPLADEVVVVVVGNGPDTSEVQAVVPERVRVVHEAWHGDEGALRSAAARHAWGQRVLFLDARERLVIRGEHATPALWRGGAGVLVEVVEADRAEPDLRAVAQGAGRLTEARLEARLLDRAVADTWYGVREPRPVVALHTLPRADMCIVSTIAIRTAGEDQDEAWIRAAAAASNDAHVLAAASRHLRDRGRRELATELAERAIESAMDGQVDALHAATVASALCALDHGDAQTAYARVAVTRGRLLSHPDLDLIQALAVIDLDRPELRRQAIGSLREALSRSGECFVHRPLPGATGDAARLALCTLLLAQGEAIEAWEQLTALSPAAERSLPAALHSAELALLEGRPATALRRLVDRLDHAGADGWILAADAAARLGQREDRNAFLDRAEAHLDRGLLAPHRCRRLESVRARIAAEAVLQRLEGEAPARPDVQDPRTAGEQAAEQGDLRAAHALLIEALRRTPADVTAWTDLGVVLHQGGAGDAAALALRVAVELSPDDADLRLQLAVVLWAAGHLGDAAEQARQALSRAELADARALLAALDVAGSRAPVVAVPAGDAEAAHRVRLARARPAPVDSELVEALGGPSAWISAAGPALILGDVLPGAELPRLPLHADLESLAAAVDVARAQLVPAASQPLLSVVIPTYDRAESLVTLLDRLALQDLPPALLEVVIVDDGSARPVERARLGARPFPVRLLRQPHAGPAAARNLGIEHACGRTIWMLDDDARPALDAARQHLIGQLQSPSDVALVGGSRLLERHRRTLWDHLLDASPLYRGRPQAALGDELDWRTFSVANTSISRAAVLDVGGFDAIHFPQASHEDAELGLRLQQAGVSLLHRPDIHAGHDHRMGVDAWIARCRAHGRAQIALRELHPDRHDVLQLGAPDAPVEPVLDALRTVIEARASHVREGTATLKRLATTPTPSDPIQARQLLLQLRRLTDLVGDDAHQRGLLDARRTRSASLRDPRLGTPSVVLVHDTERPGATNALHATIEGLRASTSGPVELIVAALGQAPTLPADVVVVAVSPGSDPLVGWNVGLSRATGDTILLCDDDVVFTPGWRAGLLDHLAAWPDVGVVCALGARSRSDLDRVAPRFAQDHRGQHAWPVRVQLGRTLIRREVLWRIGGLDPALGPLAGHDLALRARRAGYRVRLAGDVLLGAVERPAAPSTEHVSAFRERHGLDPLVRDELQLAAERPFDVRRDVQPLPTLDAPPRLLDPAGWPIRPPRPQVDADAIAVAK